jgi:hypothetical protein
MDDETDAVAFAPGVFDLGWPRPTRTEPRGEFPAHDDDRAAGRRPRTRAAARLYAWRRLAAWRRDHG